MYHYYTCGGKIRKNHCNFVNFKKDELENKVLTYVKSALTDDVIVNVSKFIFKELNQSNDKLLIKEYERNIRTIDSKIEKLVDAIANGVDPLLMKEKIEKLKIEKETLSVEIRKLDTIFIRLSEEDIRSTLFRIRDAKIDDLLAKKFFVDTFLDRVYVGNKKILVLLNIKGELPFDKKNEHIWCSNETLMAGLNEVYTNFHMIIDNYSLIIVLEHLLSL